MAAQKWQVLAEEYGSVHHFQMLAMKSYGRSNHSKF